MKAYSLYLRLMAAGGRKSYYYDPFGDPFGEPFVRGRKIRDWKVWLYGAPKHNRPVNNFVKNN